jgi:hypothetical protein
VICLLVSMKFSIRATRLAPRKLQKDDRLGRLPQSAEGHKEYLVAVGLRLCSPKHRVWYLWSKRSEPSNLDNFGGLSIT